MQKKFENEIKSLLDQIMSENSSLKENNQKIREEYEEISKTKRVIYNILKNFMFIKLMFQKEIRRRLWQ